MIDPVKFSGPQPLTTRQEQVRFTNRLQFLPGPLPGRWWGLNPDSVRAGVASDRAVTALNANVTEEELRALLVQISTIETSLVQQWKADATPPEQVEVWLNPLTGEQLRNPWLEPQDTKGMNLIARVEPKLADALRAVADDPWKYVAEQRAAEARRKSLSLIKYDSTSHESNPFRDTTVTGSQRQAEFLTANANNRLLIEVYRRWEARDVALPWAASTIYLDGCSKIIESLRGSPLPGIDPDAIMLSKLFDTKIRAAEVLALENEAAAAVARAKGLLAA